MPRLSCLLLPVLMLPAALEAAPSFDCAKAESSAEELICTDAALAALDSRLAERFAAALATVRGLDAGSAEAEADLRATQRGWIGGRDECWKAGDLRSCVEQSYLTREAELVAFWMLEPASSTAFWSCSNPADEIVTIFFETALPSVRLEIGDRVSTAALAPAASGSRYEGAFGESIWIKGDEATYRAPDPDGSTKTCTLSKEG